MGRISLRRRNVGQLDWTYALVGLSSSLESGRGRPSGGVLLARMKVSFMLKNFYRSAFKLSQPPAEGRRTSNPFV